MPPLAHRRRAQVGLDHARVLLHLLRRALGDLLAVVEHRDPVGDPHHDAHVVLDQQHRQPSSSRSRLTKSVKSAVSCGFMPAVGSSSRELRLRSRARGRPRAAAGRRRRGCARPRRSRPRSPQKLSSSRPARRAWPPRAWPRRAQDRLRIPPCSRACIPTRTFSSAVMFWKRRMFWNVRPMPRSVNACGGLPVTSSPSKTITPPSACRRR